MERGAGDVTFGLGRARSGAARHAFTWHVVESGKGVVYDTNNWLQRKDGSPFPKLYEEGV